MKKLRRLTVENFQCHEFTEIDFSPGFNVIIGESDQGKSALLRALKWLLYNEPRGADFIRIGATETRVTVLLTDGCQITRERTPSRNRYYLLLPGQEENIFAGFGSRVPREIQDALGMGKVKLDEDLERALNLGEQLEPPFLLAETGSVKAKAIGRLYGVHIVDAALRETIRDMNRAQQEEKRLTERLQLVSQELKNFSDLPGLAQQIEKLTDKLGEIEIHRDRLATCCELKQKKEEMDAHILQAEVIIKGLVELAKCEEAVEKVARNLWRYNLLREYSRELVEAREKILEAARVLQATQDLERAEKLWEAAGQCRRVGTEIANYYREKKRAETYIGRARKVLERTDRLEEAAKYLVLFQEKGTEVSRLIKYRQEYQASSQQGKGAQEAILAAEREVRRYIDKYGILLQRLGKCPLCYSNITPEILRGILQEYTGEGGKWAMRKN